MTPTDPGPTDTFLLPSQGPHRAGASREGLPSQPETLPQLHDLSERLRKSTGAIHLLHGHSDVFHAGLLIASAANEPFVAIDGAMRFNSYTLSAIALRLRMNPRDILHRTYITRSFTAFQTEAAITNKLPRFLRSHPCRLIVTLGLLDTYYDEQIAAPECVHSLRRIIGTLRALAAKGIHILIVDVEVDAPPGKNGLFPFLRRNATDSFKLGTRERTALKKGTDRNGTK